MLPAKQRAHGGVRETACEQHAAASRRRRGLWHCHCQCHWQWHAKKKKKKKEKKKEEKEAHFSETRYLRSLPMLRAAAVSALLLCVHANPEQRSLALTENGPTEMAVTWASMTAYDASATGKVTYGPAGGASQTAAAEVLTYSASLGWTGTIFKAVMTSLTPGAAYTYTVSDASGNTSAPQAFNAAPPANADAALRVAVLADMGTLQLFGWATAAALIADHKARPYDLALIAGEAGARRDEPRAGGARDAARQRGCNILAPS